MSFFSDLDHIFVDLCGDLERDRFLADLGGDLDDVLFRVDLDGLGGDLDGVLFRGDLDLERFWIGNIGSSYEYLPSTSLEITPEAVRSTPVFMKLLR